MWKKHISNHFLPRNKYQNPLKLSHFIRFLIALLVLVASFLIYYPGLNGSFFVLDDLYTISQIPVLTNLDELLIVLQGNDTGYFNRPFSIALLSIIKTLGNNQPEFFKYFSFCFHLLNSFLIFIFLRHLFKSSEKQDDVNLALITACIWLVHPLLVSTVLYPVQLMTVLAVFFKLVALNIYIYVRINAKEGNLALSLTLLTVVLAAILSKEIGVLLPVHFLALEWLFLSKSHRLQETHPFKIVFISLPLVAGGIVFLTILPDFIQAYQFRDFSITERMTAEIVIVATYIKQIVVPNIFQMTLFQDYWQTSQLSMGVVVFSGLFLLILMVLAYILKDRHPFVSYGIVFFFINHLLESTIIPLELAFEHRNYFAALGFILILTCTLEKLNSKSYFILSVIILVAMTLTSIRVSDWSSDIRFYKVSATKHPDSPRAMEAYAQSLILQGKLEQGETVFKKLITQYPNNAYYPLKLITASCAKEPSKAGNLLNQYKFSDKNFNNYNNQVLFELYHLVFTRECHIPFKHLIDFHIQLLNQKDTMENQSLRQVVQLLLARYYWLDKQEQKSIFHYLELTKENRLDAIFELTSIYQLTNNKESFNELKKNIKRLYPDMSYKNRRIADQFISE